MNNFLQRTATGAIYVAAIAGSVFAGSLAFAVLFFIVSILTMHEFYKLLNKQINTTIHLSKAIIAGSLVYLTISLIALELIEAKYVLVISFIPVALIISEIYRDKEIPLKNVAFSLMGVMYIAAPLALLVMVQSYPALSAGSPTPWIIMSLFVFIWVNDTFAYLTGKLAGRHKLFECISPKKTWEGTIGGLLFTLVAGFLFHHFIQILLLHEWLIFAILVAVSGTYGDLAESLIKRKLQVKDSGNILPGHGGLLDRLDSLLFASPVAVIFLYIIK